MSQTTSRQTAWYVSRRDKGGEGEATGPFATDMVLAMIRAGELEPLDLVFREGETEWRPVATYHELKASNTSAAKSIEHSGSPSLATASYAATAQPRAGSGKSQSWIVLRPHNSTYLQEGPFETEFIIEGLQQGKFQFSQYAWHVGMDQWMRIGDLREFDRRSRSRESKPHVPPPLPDPIAAVLLEDDADSEAEEFRISMRGLVNQDVTPNPLESVREMGVSELGSVGVGGAAAESPEEKTAQERASHAVSLVVSSPDLAGVPWEKDASDGYAQSVELIDDEHSGFHSPQVGPNLLVEKASEDRGDQAQTLEKTPLPFVPSAPFARKGDAWEKWGRHVAGASMFVVFSIFSWHLVTAPSVSRVNLEAVQARVAEKLEVKSDILVSPSAVAPTAAPAVAPVTNPTEVPAAVPVVASSPIDLRQSAVAPPVAAVASDIGIVGLKLDRPDGQIVIQGTFPAGAPINVTFKGRLGQVLSKMSVRKTVSVERKNGEVPSLRLKDLKLPEGAYTIEVEIAGAKAKNEIFVGVRNSKFIDRLETHLREISFETQTQKKTLFYSAQELDILARELGQNYGQLRGKPEAWESFYRGWNKKVDSVRRSLTDLAKKSQDDMAYPEETASLQVAMKSLGDVAAQYDQATRQRRDVASDTLTDLIAELTRQKTTIGDTTARPTADTPDGML